MSDKENQNKKISFSRKRTPGEIVAARRKELGLTQEELSWRTGISTTHIGRIENDATRAGFDTIEKLEEALEIPLIDAFVEFRKSLDPEKKRYLPTADAIRRFERELAKSGLSGEELDEVLGKALSDVEAKDKKP